MINLALKIVKKMMPKLMQKVVVINDENRGSKIVKIWSKMTPYKIIEN
jgi:hypothetical protein